MKVEVYLKNKSQEFTSNQPLEAWTGRWSWAPSRRVHEGSGIGTIQYRRESYGGLIHNLKTDVVYKADKEAIDVIEELKKGLSVESICNKYNLQKEQVDDLISRVVD